MRTIHFKWSTFTYNFGWSDWVSYMDGWIPRFSLFFPIVGYLILFNDSVSESLVFTNLTSPKISWGLSGVGRLRFLYFGLLFLGCSNLIYRLKKPYLFRLGTNLVDYSRTALEIFTYGDFLQIHGIIRDKGNITVEGKYYDSEWEGFSNAAINHKNTVTAQKNQNWDEAKRQYGGLLLSILREGFYQQDRARRAWLSICIMISNSGYLLLAIPGADLFIKVIQSTI